LPGIYFKSPDYESSRGFCFYIDIIRNDTQIIYMPNLYIIAGCNGAGKTTASYTILPEMLHCNEFVNADSIALGLSPFNPESQSFSAGRLMLKRIKQLMAEKVDFAIETTLTTKSYKQLILDAKSYGYIVTLVFFWISSSKLALDRIKIRVKKGGHDVPKEVVERRYKRGLENLFRIFIPICDYWIIMDNSTDNSIIIAEGNLNVDKKVYNNEIWGKIHDKENTTGK